jgi:hypothetical protein
MDFDPEAMRRQADDVGEHEPEARPAYAETVAFFGHLAYKVPALRGTLAKHLLDTEGEMLPHLFMEDVLHWLVAEGRPATDKDVRLVLRVLDEGYRNGSEPFRSLVVVSFIEAIPGFHRGFADAGGKGEALRKALGPALTAVAKELDRHRRSGSQALG